MDKDKTTVHNCCAHTDCACRTAPIGPVPTYPAGAARPARTLKQTPPAPNFMGSGPRSSAGVSMDMSRSACGLSMSPSFIAKCSAEDFIIQLKVLRCTEGHSYRDVIILAIEQFGIPT